MSKKRKPDNGLDDTPQLKPIGKSSGKGKGWQKYFQSNAVKAGILGAVVLLIVLIVGWQLMSGGSAEQNRLGPLPLQTRIKRRRLLRLRRCPPSQRR